MRFLNISSDDYADWSARLSESVERLLILDYDGTLAPFRVEREEATPYEGIKELLLSIASRGDTRIVVVSGRSVEEVSGLLSMDRSIEYWGAHGWERMARDGAVMAIDPGEHARAGLAKASEIAASYATKDRIETKYASVALHWRGVDQSARRDLLDRISPIWSDIAREYDLSLKSFDGGLEIMAKGRDKGNAVREILGSSSSDSVAAYLGDDLTDEDAFRALRPSDLGILVSERLRPTAADVWIRPPGELFEFLDSWVETGGER